MKKIVADQNFECATTKNHDSARKIEPIPRHLSAPSLSSCDDASTLHSKLFLFLEGRQKSLEGRTSQQAPF